MSIIKALWDKIIASEDERERRERVQHRAGSTARRPFNFKEAERLRNYVTRRRRDSDWYRIKLSLLVFGPVGHGKSSFCNGCRSAIRGTPIPSTYHQVANAAHGSFTKGFHGAEYEDHWITDMPGIFETDKITSMNIENIITGKVPFHAEINEFLEIKDNNTYEKTSPANSVSCVVIILRYDADLGPEVRRQIGVILELAGRGVLSYILVLTRLNECDPQLNLKENFPYIYMSSKVKAAVKRMSEETGIPPYAINFVSNYTEEAETDTYTSLLHLRALERAIDSSIDQIEKRIDKRRQRRRYSSFFSSEMFLFVMLTGVVLIGSVYIYFYKL